jgi:hypothetical protein
MNYSVFSQKIYNALLKAYKWYLQTPERSLEKAFQAASEIKAIEEEHFNGQKIGSPSASYSSSALDYFNVDLKKLLRIIRMRLTEFKASRYFLNNSNQTVLTRYGIEHLNPSIVLEKLRFIDEVTAKYNLDDDLSIVDDLRTKDKNTSNVTDQSTAIQLKYPGLLSKKPNNLPPKPHNKTDTTGVLPRSIFNTISRLQEELDPNAEQEVLQSFRQTKKRTVISVRFLLLLVIVPVLVNQLSKPVIIGPIIDHFRSSGEEIGLFLNYEMEEEALSELEKFEQKIRFEHLIQNNAPLSVEQIEEQLKEKARDLAEEYRVASTDAIKNVFADILSVGAFTLVLIFSKKEIVLLKDFFDDILYGLSDSAKAFIIILFTDIFVGFHSPHGWEVLLEGISRHWGLPANHDFIFLFIATFPVILDTIFKYWIFRYLNRISPSAVATYRNMNE